MSTAVTPVTLDSLTTSSVDGTGAFDVLMRAMKAHLEEEFRAGRIKASEYASVYLGATQQVLTTALQFLLQRDNATLTAEKLRIEIELVTAQEALVNQQRLNAVQEGLNLVAQECVLRAQFDNTQKNTLKSESEIALLNQKTLTERAQVGATGVDEDSVIGRQKGLYKAQTDGFKRDAEQKAADLMIKSWATRRTTDEGTVADGVNMLQDSAVGRAVTAMLNGINA